MSPKSEMGLWGDKNWRFDCKNTGLGASIRIGWGSKLVLGLLLGEAATVLGNKPKSLELNEQLSMEQKQVKNPRLSVNSGIQSSQSKLHSRVSSMSAFMAVGSLCALVLLSAACGKVNEGGSVDGVLYSPEERVNLILNNAFGGTYSPHDPENTQLAAKIEGASATVAVQKGEEGAGQQAHVFVSVLVKNVGEPISAEGIIYGDNLEELANYPGGPEKFALEARCLGSACARLVVRLVEFTEIEKQSKDKKDRTLIKRSQAAMIFAKEPKKLPQKTGGDEKQSKSGFDQDEPLVLEWKASPNSNNFFGGEKTSVSRALLKRMKPEGPASDEMQDMVKTEKKEF